MFYDKSTKVICVFKGILFVACLGILAYGISYYVKCWQFKNSAVLINSIISEISPGTEPEDEFRSFVYVSYPFNGKMNYNVPLRYYHIFMRVGQYMEIYCLPGEDGVIVAKSALFVIPVFLIIVGLITSSIFGHIFIWSVYKVVVYDLLLTSRGKTLIATIDKIHRRDKYAVIGSMVYRVYCSYKDEATDKVYKFRSDDIWYNPSFCYEVGGPVEVRVMKKNYRHYLVNIGQMSIKWEDYEKYDNPANAGVKEEAG